MSVVGGIRDVGGSVTSGNMQHPAAPASIAESMWPEDLLQVRHDVRVKCGLQLQEAHTLQSLCSLLLDWIL